MKTLINPVKYILTAASLCATSFAFGDSYTYSASQNFKITYEGAAVNDFPLLLKLDATKVPDLYDLVKHDGADLFFSSLDGTEYPFEVDTWNSSGTSLVWVKVPKFEKDAQFRMQYGCAEKTTNPNSTQVWTGYDYVSHVNKNANDSTANAVIGALNPNSDVCHYVDDAAIGSGYGTMVAGYGPAISAWVFKNESTKDRSRVLDDPIFTVSFWVRYNGTPIAWNYICGVSGGWTLDVANITQGGVQMTASSSYKNTFKKAGMFDTGTWLKIDAVYDNTTFNFYLNGDQVGTPFTSASGATIGYHNWLSWGDVQVGNTATPSFGNSKSNAADFDECRVYGGVADAARVAADYAVVTGDYCEAVSAEAPYVTIDLITANLTSEYIPSILTLGAAATLHNADGTIIYRWDLDDDGEYDDAEGAIVVQELTEAKSFTPAVMVTVEEIAELAAQAKAESKVEVRERSISLSLEVTPTVVKVPDMVTFTANTVSDGIEGELTYIWKTNDVEIAQTKDSTYQFEYTEISSFIPSVTITVEGSEYTTTAVGPEVMAIAAYYVDSEAEDGGVGTQESPFNKLDDAFSRLASAEAIYLKGNFVLPTTGFVFARNDFVLGKWGEADDPKPVLSRDDFEQAPATGVFQITGENVIISDISFNYPREVHFGGPLIRVNANGANIRNCDFELSSAPEKVCYNGVISSGDNIDWEVDGCSFKGYGVAGDVAYRVLLVDGGVIIKNSHFEECSSIIAQQANNPWNNPAVQFVSNIVYNSKATAESGANAGAVAVCDSWKYCKGLIIAHNILVNDKEGEEAGCVVTIRGKNNPYQNGPLSVYNNTIVGYKAVVEVDGLELPESANNRNTVLQVFNNLCNGAIPLYFDEQASWQLKAGKVSFIRNNVLTSDAYTHVLNYILTDEAIVEGNQTIPSFRFVSTNPTSPDFYCPKAAKKMIRLTRAAGRMKGSIPRTLERLSPS